MKNIILITLLFLVLSGCHNVPVWQYSLFDRPNGLGNYPDIYIKGWQHGCQSGAQASANHLYRLKYKFTQDWRLLDNRTYVGGWEAAYNHCRKYVLQHNLRKVYKF